MIPVMIVDVADVEVKVDCWITNIAAEESSRMKTCLKSRTPLAFRP